ncbi:MAG: peptidase C69 [Proteobacteria bacterium]|nr:MAG: peptidase C69 [Pseudomonadota bacterium]
MEAAACDEDWLNSLVEGALKTSKAEGIEIYLKAQQIGNIRVARSAVTTSGRIMRVEAAVTSHFGTKAGKASGTIEGLEGLCALVRRSEEMARAAEPSLEFVSPKEFGAQKIESVSAFDSETAKARSRDAAQLLAEAIGDSARGDILYAAYLEYGTQCELFSNSAGSRFSHLSTLAKCSVTARAASGEGSGKAYSASEKIRELDLKRSFADAASSARASLHSKELPPGSYSVILMPPAVADMLHFMFWMMEQRAADEGRSYFSKEAGGSRIGQELFSPLVSIWSDSAQHLAPSAPFDPDGVPLARRDWVKGGILKDLLRDKFWARKCGAGASPAPSNLIMAGSEMPPEELIRSCKRALLVNHLWYIRVLDPNTLLLTGLTRDGTFLVEDGVIKDSVKNFRFNDSPVNMLRGITRLSQAHRTLGNETDERKYVVPALELTSFCFSSVSDAV